MLRDSGHEHLNGSLVVPIFADDGEVLELYGRRLCVERKGAPHHLYLPKRGDGRRGVFNREGMKSSKEIILCEALIDALTFWCAGYTNVTSAYGVEGFTPEMREALLEHGIARVLIAYDGDEAGDRAATTLAGELAKDGLEVYRVLFPREMDANAYALETQPASASLGALIEHARWMAGPRPPDVRHLLVAEIAPVAVRETAATVHTPDSCESAPESAASGATAIDISTGTSDRDERHGELARILAKTPAQQTTTIEASACLSDRTACETAAIDPRDARENDLDESTPSEKLPSPSIRAATPTPAPAPSSSSAPSLVALVMQDAPASATKLDAEISDDEMRLRLGDRRWRIRGLSRTNAQGTLRLNVFVSRGDNFFVDTLELYNARHRGAFLEQAAAELGVEAPILKSDIGKILMRLEALVEERLAKSAHPEPAFTMTDAQRAEALALLRDLRLLDRILEDFDRAGVVGEETNKLIGYVAAISRKLEAPLAVVIQSSSAAGKSSLMDAVLRFMPEEERVQYSAMTGQSLFYMGETDLSHKILAIAEEQGVQSAAYALKLLQSEGELTIASTGKDPLTGKLVTQEYRVEGPVMIFLTTTAIEVDEELLNRCLILTVDEGVQQTSAIQERQRESQTLEGLLRNRDREHIIALHQNAQRLLEPLLVANPYAKELRFSSAATRAQRDHMKYLTLIRSIALLHQHQREVKTVTHRGEILRYVKVTRADIAIADRLAASVLGHDVDEMPPQTRRLLELVEEMVSAEAKTKAIEPSAVRFTRKDVRVYTRWSHSALKKHLARLEELEHLVLHGGGARRRTIYELAYDRSGHPGNPNWSPPETNWSPSGHPRVIAEARPDSPPDLLVKRDLVTSSVKTRLGTSEKKRSYPKNGEARP